jgi:mannose-6-phosphate isomerase-like protein (cupin superfamily)
MYQDVEQLDTFQVARDDCGMPLYASGQWLGPHNRPNWSSLNAVGRFAVPREGGRFERHLHADDELWFITAGKARVLVGAEELDVQAGDIVLTRGGDLHDVIAVYEDLAGFFAETGSPAGEFGHRYLDPADASGHDVPALPLPAGFPVRKA